MIDFGCRSIPKRFHRQVLRCWIIQARGWILKYSMKSWKKHDSLNPMCRYGNWLQPTVIGILVPRLDQAERYSFHREIIFKENIQMPGMRFTERRDVIGGCAKSMRGCDVYSFKTNTDRGVYLIRTMHTQYGGVKVKTTKCRGLSLPASSFPRHMKFSSKTVLKQPGTNCQRCQGETHTESLL